MADEKDAFSTRELAIQRIKDFVELLSKQGFTQTQIAVRAGLPPQYLSDIKRGQRPITELVARRLGEEFNVNFPWLMGTSSSMERPQLSSANKPGESASWLPLFSHPIAGEPRIHPQWDGAGVEVAGVAAAQLVLSKFPYVLRFGRSDIRGRLQEGDLILISQEANSAAPFQVVSYRKKSFLVRGAEDGTWERVADGNKLPENCPVTGHCIGIVWSSLL